MNIIASRHSAFPFPVEEKMRLFVLRSLSPVYPRLGHQRAVGVVSVLICASLLNLLVCRTVDAQAIGIFHEQAENIVWLFLWHIPVSSL